MHLSGKSHLPVRVRVRPQGFVSLLCTSWYVGSQPNQLGLNLNASSLYYALVGGEFTASSIYCAPVGRWVQGLVIFAIHQLICGYLILVIY